MEQPKIVVAATVTVIMKVNYTHVDFVRAHYKNPLNKSLLIVIESS